MNIYATPVTQWPNGTVHDALGTEAHYIERGTYQSVKNFLRYRRPLENWPNKVFALYTFSGSISGRDTTLIGYIYNHNEDNHALAQAHLANHRSEKLPERIGYGAF